MRYTISSGRKTLFHKMVQEQIYLIPSFTNTTIHLIGILPQKREALNLSKLNDCTQIKLKLIFWRRLDPRGLLLLFCRLISRKIYSKLREIVVLSSKVPSQWRLRPERWHSPPFPWVRKRKRTKRRSKRHEWRSNI